MTPKFAALLAVIVCLFCATSAEARLFNHRARVAVPVQVVAVPMAPVAVQATIKAPRVRLHVRTAKAAQRPSCCAPAGPAAK